MSKRIDSVVVFHAAFLKKGQKISYCIYSDMIAIHDRPLEELVTELSEATDVYDCVVNENVWVFDITPVSEYLVSGFSEVLNIEGPDTFRPYFPQLKKLFDAERERLNKNPDRVDATELNIFTAWEYRYIPADPGDYDGGDYEHGLLGQIRMSRLGEIIEPA